MSMAPAGIKNHHVCCFVILPPSLFFHLQIIARGLLYYLPSWLFFPTMERRWFNAPVSWPFACVLSKCRHVFSETDDALVPRVMLRIICECACRLLALKTHNGDELAEIFGFPEQFSRKIALDSGLHFALPVLMQGNDSILLASFRPVYGNGHEHLSSPLLHRELTCALQAASPNARGSPMCIGTTIPSPDSNYIGGPSHLWSALPNVKNFARYGRILP